MIEEPRRAIFEWLNVEKFGEIWVEIEPAPPKDFVPRCAGIRMEGYKTELPECDDCPTFIKNKCTYKEAKNGRRTTV